MEDPGCEASEETQLEGKLTMVNTEGTQEGRGEFFPTLPVVRKLPLNSLPFPATHVGKAVAVKI